jgi:hypothetical protein
MLYIKFVGMVPRGIEREVALDASTREQAEQILSKVTGEPCNIEFLSGLDQRPNYDTIITIGRYGEHPTKTSFVKVLQ